MQARAATTRSGLEPMRIRNGVCLEFGAFHSRSFGRTGPLDGLLPEPALCKIKASADTAFLDFCRSWRRRLPASRAAGR